MWIWALPAPPSRFCCQQPHYRPVQHIVWIALWGITATLDQLPRLILPCIWINTRVYIAQLSSSVTRITLIPNYICCFPVYLLLMCGGGCVFAFVCVCVLLCSCVCVCACVRACVGVSVYLCIFCFIIAWSDVRRCVRVAVVFPDPGLNGCFDGAIGAAWQLSESRTR